AYRRRRLRGRRSAVRLALATRAHASRCGRIEGGAMRRRLLRAAAVLGISVGLLAACEGVLRLLKFGPPTASGSNAPGDPPPLFLPVTGADGVAMLQRSDAPVAFRQEKPANGVRIFVVGESSAFGYPFGPEFAFSAFLQQRVSAAKPDRTVEVVNAAIPGIG